MISHTYISLPEGSRDKRHLWGHMLLLKCVAAHVNMRNQDRFFHSWTNDSVRPTNCQNLGLSYQTLHKIYTLGLYIYIYIYGL